MSYVTKNLKKLIQKDTYVHFLQTLRYSLYVILHPADGNWDLIHAKRGSYSAANFIVILTLLTHIWKLQYTSFIFNEVNWEKVNIFKEIATILLPLAIFCICNWAVTTLFDGKGHLGDIYKGTAYALTPYPLIQIPLIIISQFLTVEEGTFYEVFNTVSLVWCALLIFMAMTEFAKRLFPDHIPYEEKLAILEECMNYENEYLIDHPGRLYEGVVETLTKLKKDYDLLLLSNCQKNYIETFLKSTHLESFFVDKVCWGDNFKPKHENMELLVNRGNYEKAFYVGDTEGDENETHLAGYRFAYASFGFGKAKNPEYILKTFSDLVEVSKKEFN